MTLRGKAAIVGIGEVPTRRVYPDRTMYGLNAEAARMAIEDAQIRKEDINGLVTDGSATPAAMAEYIGIRPTFATGVMMQGASGATATTVAASAIIAGLCDTVLVVMGNSRLERIAVGSSPGIRSEWEEQFGPAAGANTGYGLIYARHMYEYGTTAEQMAKIAVDERFNAVPNENSAFFGQPITLDDVLNSRYINYPLHILESVMPCDGAAACIITTAERAKSLPNRPVYILGAGLEQGAGNIWQTPRITTTPTKVSAAKAFQMAGYGPKDMQFAEFYD
ncbi:MAG: thiolase family protein [Chloroflexi bacterium]|nr:thiolase family protein [Chloroflexota bacterium]